MAKIDHPNIVSIFEAGQHKNTLFIAMPYIKGKDLDITLFRKGILTEKKVLYIAEKIAVAMGHVWDKTGIIHNDIKPGNIILDHDNTVKVLDLGITTLIKNRSTISKKLTTIVGTPYYISPERVQGASYDYRSDIYSLGATMYHLLVGEPLYMSNDPVQIMAQHCSEAVPPFGDKTDRLSIPCEKLIKRMLAKDPQERQKNWKLLLDDIHAVQEGDSLIILEVLEHILVAYR